MATIFYSGVDRPDLLSLLVAEKAAGMINANYARHPRLQQAYSRPLPIPLVLDSYKFQNDISRYTEIILQVGMHFRWMSNLDVIGNQRVSDQHFEYLQAHLPAHLAQKILWVFQPGGSLHELEDMARHRHLIGIGGLVPLLKRQEHEAVLRYLFSVGERLQSVGAQAHVFGLSSPSIIFRIRHCLWLASIDSSKWLIAYRASKVVRTNGTGQCRASELGLCLTPQEMAANNIRVMRFWLLAPSVQLPLFEEINAFLDEPDEEMLVYQFIVLLQRALDDAFLEHFAGQMMGLDAGDEEGHLFYSLSGPPALEEDLIRWCEDAKSAERLTDYDIWCEEEAIAV
jgi:hypothetical protein